MITIDLGKNEHYDEVNNEFIYEDRGIVRFEYTLRMIYEWEEKWRKPFLKGEFTDEELDDFYMRMALDPFDERYLNDEVRHLLSEHIKDPNTATTFTIHGASKGGGNSGAGKVYTSEEIYALMFSAGVDLEFEDRNLNRLMTVLRIIQSYNSPPKKMDRQDVLKQNAELNAQRRAAMKTRG